MNRMSSHTNDTKA